MADNFERTERGFIIYDRFTDRYGTEVVVQESSIAGEWCAWVFANNMHMEEPSPHLTVENAERLIAALQKFIDHSSAWRNDPEYVKVWGPESDDDVE